MPSRLSFEYRHRVDGYVKLSENLNVVQIKCRWPFDLDADEWINISNEFHAEDYSVAIQNALSKGSGKASGVQGGYIEVINDTDGFTLDFSNPYTGWQSKTLRIKVKQPLLNLQLRD